MKLIDLKLIFRVVGTICVIWYSIFAGALLAHYTR